MIDPTTELNDLTVKLRNFTCQLKKVHSPDKTMWWHGYDSNADIFDVLNDLIKQSESNYAAMREYIGNKASNCIHPNCECLDYCEADDPHSKTPTR